MRNLILFWPFLLLVMWGCNRGKAPAPSDGTQSSSGQPVQPDKPKEFKRGALDPAVWSWKTLKEEIRPGMSRSEVEGKLGKPLREIDFFDNRRASYSMGDDPLAAGEIPKNGEYLSGVTVTYDSSGVVKYIDPDVMVISERP